MKILVIEPFGLNLGYLGCYGNDWVATPNLDRLATQSVVFDWHIVDQPELLPVTAWRQRTVASGNYPWSTREEPIAVVPRVARIESLHHFADRALGEIAKGGDWLWIEGPSLLPPWSLDEELLEIYFDEDDVEEGLSPWRDPPMEVVKLDDAEVLQLQNSYAAVVTFFDAQLGKLLANLNDRQDSLLCLTARTGLPLGEHGMIGAPLPMLHEELVHAPLMMRLPESAEAGSRIGALTQPIDLLPTFLESLGIPAPSRHGQSLWPLIRGESHSIRDLAVSSLRSADQETWLARTVGHAFHMQTPPAGMKEAPSQLYVKPEDRWEVNNLLQPLIETADDLQRQLREVTAHTTRRGQ
jgi:arylsulfatase A-like enzyme